jgi:chromosome segregation ATPase
LNSDNKALKKEIDQSKSMSSEIQNSHSKSITEFGQHGSGLRRQIAELTAEKETLANKIRKSKSKKTVLKNENLQLGTQFATLNSENAKLKSHFTTLNFDREKWRSEKTRLTAEVVSHSSNNSQLLADLEAAREIMKAQQRDIEKLRLFEAVFHQSVEILEESQIPVSKFPEVLRNRIRPNKEAASTQCSESSDERPAQAPRQPTLTPVVLEEFNRQQPVVRPAKRRVAPNIDAQPQNEISLDKIIQMHNRLWRQENEQTSLFTRKRPPR